MKRRRTAEFVSPKHPDKICDRISDTILDLYLSDDPNSRCAIETAAGHGMAFITGEVTSKADISDDDIRTVVNNLSGIGDITVNLIKQSPEIARGVDTGGAGDQGIMIGYACKENGEGVPQEYYLARELNKHIYKVFPYDGKTQVTIHEFPYDHTVDVVASFQHAPKEELERICKKFFVEHNYNIKSLHCNPAGDWNIGGLDADAGLTGRKLVVDNYGPRVSIGGGAYSGKDATKVDRSAAYMARRIALDYLTQRGSTEVLVQLAYAIGYPQPVEATAIVHGEPIHISYQDYDLRPQAIIETLDLKKPIYAKTAEWGHYGNTKFSWNRISN